MKTTRQLIVYSCERCQHEWLPRNQQRQPRVCPRCKSAYWDRARKTAEQQAQSAPVAAPAVKHGTVPAVKHTLTRAEEIEQRYGGALTLPITPQ